MECLLPYCRMVDRLVYDFSITKVIVLVINRILGTSDNGNRFFTGFHKHEKAYVISENLSTYKDYFSFAFVRNPFDLIVSLYFYIRQSKSHKYHSIVMSQSFFEFVPWYLETNPEKQMDFISDPKTGQVIVNFIGYFESLESDLIRLQEIIGVKMTAPHKNRSKKRNKSYQEYYDNKTQVLVHDYFLEDLVALNYSY